MKALLLTAATLASAAMLAGCVIVVDGDDDDDDVSLRLDYETGPSGVSDPAVEESLAAFSMLDTSAGGQIIVRKGDTHSIRLDEKAAERGTFSVDDGTLSITCKQPCRNGGIKGEIEVTMVALDGVRSSSGSSVKFVGDFAPAALSVSASSGAVIDARSVRTGMAKVSASSGARVMIWASDELSGDASSGAQIIYKGSPETVNVSTSSGAMVRAGK